MNLSLNLWTVFLCMTRTDVAYYSGTDQKVGKASLSQSQSFTRGVRKTIVSFGITDNPCSKFYHLKPASDVQQTKSLASGPKRLAQYQSTERNHEISKSTERQD